MIYIICELGTKESFKRDPEIKKRLQKIYLIKTRLQLCGPRSVKIYSLAHLLYCNFE